MNLVDQIPNRPGSADVYVWEHNGRYSVIHPACGVNIRPTPKYQEAVKKAKTHAGKCSGR